MIPNLIFEHYDEAEVLLERHVFPIEGMGKFSQTYERIGGVGKYRMRSGRLNVQKRWSKWSITISGEGWVPSGVEALSESKTYLMKCASVMTATSHTTAVTLPPLRDANADPTIKFFRRNEVQEPTLYPYAQAVVNGQVVPAVISSLVSDVALITAVPGASTYRVMYYPEIEVSLNPSGDVDKYDSAYAWSIKAEEI